MVSYSAEESNLHDAGPAVVALWARNLSGMSAGFAQGKLEAGYLNNPAGAGAGVLLRSSGQAEPVGVICVHPRRMWWGAQRLNAATLSDYAVDTAHRTLGPAVMLMRRALALASGRFELVVGSPNAKSEAVCKRAGLVCMGTIERYTAVLRSRFYFARNMPAWAAAVVAVPADVVLVLATVVRSFLLWPRLSFVAETFNSPALDDIWQRRPAQLLLGERSAALLKWRYGSGLHGSWQIGVARQANGTAVGWVVWRELLGVADVGDFFSTEPVTMTAPLLNAFARHARWRGLHSVSVRFFGHHGVHAAMHGAGYLSRPTQRHIYRGASPAAGIEAREHWYVTEFDNDAN